MKKIIKISTAICGALLAVLGFAKAVTAFAAPQYGIPMDRMPPRNIISGRVTDKVTGKPIKGIKVSNQFQNVDVQSEGYYIPYSFSDENGEYYIPIWDKTHPNLKFSDVDSTENGLYNDTIVAVDVRNIALTPKK